MDKFEVTSGLGGSSMEGVPYLVGRLTVPPRGMGRMSVRRRCPKSKKTKKKGDGNLGEPRPAPSCQAFGVIQKLLRICLGALYSVPDQEKQNTIEN